MRCSHVPLTSVQWRQVNNPALVIRIVFTDDLAKLKVTQMQDGRQDAIHRIHFIVLETKHSETGLQLLEPTHVQLE